MCEKKKESIMSSIRVVCIYLHATLGEQNKKQEKPTIDFLPQVGPHFRIFFSVTSSHHHRHN
jgi:hypothetical protein